MERLIVNMLFVFGAFFGMEGVAWLAHKYVMHGLLWRWHKDHHKKETEGFLEHNDFFFVVFALPGILCLYFGLDAGFNYLFWIGLGITIYGFAYFFIHDIFIHQRFKLLRNANHRYLKAIRRAHKIHHKHLGKHDGECFGMLWVPKRFFVQKDNGKTAV